MGEGKGNAKIREREGGGRYGGREGWREGGREGGRERERERKIKRGNYMTLNLDFACLQLLLESGADPRIHADDGAIPEQVIRSVHLSLL